MKLDGPTKFALVLFVLALLFAVGIVAVDLSDAGAAFGDVLVDVGVGPAWGALLDLTVAVPADQETEVGALAVRQAGDGFERVAGLDRVVELRLAGKDVVPVAVFGSQIFEPGFAALLSG